MRVPRSAARLAASAAAALAVCVPAAGVAQQDTAGEGTRTRIDVIPFAGYAYGTAQSRHAIVGAVRIGMGTETWGVAYTQATWVAGWDCPSDADAPCDDPTSYTLGVERWFTRPNGAVLIAGADAGVLSWYGTRALGVARIGAERSVPPLGAIRVEGQAQKVLGLDVATLAVLVGFRFSFGGPRLPRR